MINEIGLSHDILTLLKNTFKKYIDIEQVTLYGSRAKGSFNQRSDIDLVAYGKDLDRFVLNQVLLDLDDSNIPYLVDLQNFHDLRNHQLIEHIKRVGRVIYRKSENIDVHVE